MQRTADVEQWQRSHMQSINLSIFLLQMSVKRGGRLREKVDAYPKER